MLHGSSSRYCFANFWDSFGKRCLYWSVCGMLDHESGPLQATGHFGNTLRQLLLFILQPGLAPTEVNHEHPNLHTVKSGFLQQT